MTSSATSDAAARPSGSHPRYRLPRTARLRRSRDIRRTMRNGRRLRGSKVDVFSTPSPVGRARVGIIVPRHGHTAVARNRVRRRLREIARTHWMPTLNERDTQVDLIFRAKPAAYGTSYRRLRDALVDRLEDICGP